MCRSTKPHFVRAIKNKAIWTRILSVYGFFDDERTLITGTIKKMLSQETLSFTRGEQVWDFLYSEDAAYILLRLAFNGKHFKIYCIGSGEGRKLRAYLEEMQSFRSKTCFWCDPVCGESSHASGSGYIRA
ncbi:NAD-dependent epimerase/dehydratase family protein [Paenibacillus sp. 1011MAR3C5]|uniref:NAD-dependent epimerase/dehydratase family protein n=1 Tax=Paenibacillus sp. 1011MAR3C5 TaxID=1675787 RepID=UPI000E6B7407|nr:NAD-dependent epimerase/dehydratase family protein [Paenibacillus sp. 1011MAR3C5]